MSVYDRERLLARFDDASVKTFTGRGGVPLSYIPHPAIRRRLIEAAGPVTFDHDPPYVLEGAIVVRGCMSINGETHTETGTEPVPSHVMMMADAIKMAVSDCWKRCAMSFGIGLELWEGEEEDFKAVAATEPVQIERPVQQQSFTPARTVNQSAGQPRRNGPPPPGVWEQKPMSDKQRAMLNGLAKQMGWTENVEHELEGIGKYLFAENWVFDFVTAGEASKLIDYLKAEVAARQMPVR